MTSAPVRDPVIRSYEPAEDRYRCYLDQSVLDSRVPRWLRRSREVGPR
jgi:hypothetical protein